MSDLPNSPPKGLPSIDSLLADLDNIVQGNVNLENIIRETSSELKEINSIEASIHLHTIDAQIETAKNAMDRTKVLFQLEKVTEEEYFQSLENQDHIDFLKGRREEAAEIERIIDEANTELIHISLTGKRSIEDARNIDRAAMKTEAEEEVQRIIKEAEKEAQKFSKLNDEITNASAEFITSQEEVRGLQNHLDKLKEEGASAKDISDAEEALKDATERFKSSEAIIEELENPVKDSRSLLNDLRIQLQEANRILQEATIRDTGSLFSDTVIRKIATTITEYTDPVVNFASRLTKSVKTIKNGYKQIAREFVEGAENSSFLEEIIGITKEEDQKITNTMMQQFKEINTLMRQEGLSKGELTDAVLSKCAEWMSPSWKLRAAQSEDMINFIETFDTFRWYKTLTVPAKFIALIIKSVVRAPLYVAARGLEHIIGPEIAAGLAEAAGATTELVSKLISALLDPSLAMALLGLYGFIDVFKVHNFGGWLYDMVNLISCGLVELDSLRLLQYPDKSIVVASGQKTGQKDPDKMWEIDHRELKFQIDFWGKRFIQEVGHLHKDDSAVYKEYVDYKAIKRIPGKYIDESFHPYDTNEELEQCKQLEKKIDLDLLVDERGDLTHDLGSNLLSNVFPRKKGYVRNLVSFPLYANTINWPDRNGEFHQTQGNDVPESLDPNIYSYWVNLVKTGRYGTIYNHPNSSVSTQQKAVDTNRKDFERYLHPVIDDPLIWDDIKTWASANKGIRKILSQEMYNVTIGVLNKEEKTIVTPLAEDDFRQDYRRLRVLYQNQDTLEFAEQKYLETGRYLMIPKCKEFYDRVVQQGIMKQVIEVGIPTPASENFKVVQRKATAREVSHFSRVLEQYNLYKQALVNKQGDIKDAWKAAIKQSTFDAYIEDTSPRNVWGYVQRIRPDLIGELMINVNLMLGKRKANVWAKYMNQIKQLRVPLNTNRYHRLAFVGRLNQLIYSNDSERTKTITSEIERMGGNIIVNQLFTTGLSKNDMVSWAKDVFKTAVIIPSLKNVDIPLYFGRIHCRVIVIDKPKQTCFIVFRGTTNFWEWVVDADFSGAEYGTIESTKTGHFNMKIEDKTETVAKDVEGLFYSDPGSFALHRGFLRCWLAFKPKLIPFLDTIYKQNNIQDVIVTGHSLGAGITQIACLELPSLPVYSRPKTSELAKLSGLHVSNTVVKYYRPHAYMYSSPAVGDRRFAWHFMNQTSESAHVYIDGDIITLIPPFLLPALESWGHASQLAFLDDLKHLAGGELGAVATIWTAISNIFKVENISNPFSWMTTKGKLDLEKIKGRIPDLFAAYNKHRASKGGGIFFRLNQDLSGNVVEVSADPGSTINAIQSVVYVLTHFDTSKLQRYHSIDNVVNTLDKVVVAHPDIFDKIDKLAHPTWDDVKDIPKTLPILNPIPSEIERKFRQGKVIAIARSKKRYLPYQMVAEEDVIPESVVRVLDVDEIKRCHDRQKKRRKIRKVTEGDYHGY